MKNVDLLASYLLSIRFVKRFVFVLTVLSLWLISWAVSRVAEPGTCINSTIVNNLVIQNSDSSWEHLPACRVSFEINPWLKRPLDPLSKLGKRIHKIKYKISRLENILKLKDLKGKRPAPYTVVIANKDKSDFWLRDQLINEQLKQRWPSLVQGSVTHGALVDLIFKTASLWETEERLSPVGLLNEDKNLRKAYLSRFIGEFWSDYYFSLSIAQKNQFWAAFSIDKLASLDELAEPVVVATELKEISKELRPLLKAATKMMFPKFNESQFSKLAATVEYLKVRPIDVVIEVDDSGSYVRVSKQLQEKVVEGRSMMVLWKGRGTFSGLEWSSFPFQPEAFLIRRYVIVGCKVPSDERLLRLKQHVKKVLFVSRCSALAEKKKVDWSWLAMGGTEYFAKMNLKVAFAEYHLPSLEILRKYWPDAKVENRKYWRLDKRLNAYRVNSPVEGITLIRPGSGLVL